MKKKFLTVILIFLCAVLCLSGCGLGSYIDSGNDSNKPSNSNRPNDDNNDDPDNNENKDTKTHYTLQVYYDNKYFSPADDIITAVWKSDYDAHRVELDAQGFADAGELDGSYAVYLEGLPKKYTYNANSNIATSDERQVSILLTNVAEPVRGYGDGRGGLYNHIMLKYDGTYRIELLSEYDVVQYVYKPTAAGYYSIESWVNAYDDEVNPYIDIYFGHENYKLFNRTQDGGAKIAEGAPSTGGYTKNFRYEVRVDAKEVGSSFCFAIHASSKSGNYPVNVDFAVRYEGEYTSNNSDIRIIRAQEANYKAPNPKVGETFTFADFGTKVFDNRNFRFNEDTGRYHYYDMTKFGNDPYGYGEGFGPVLYCAIDKAIQSYALTTLYNADKTGSDGISFNYLKLYNVWIEEEQKFAVFDYTDFIKQDYYNVCNNEGVCYVTKELKAFLQKFAENHSLYTDHVGAGSGMPEALGYSANQDALWLFACGVYMK